MDAETARMARQAMSLIVEYYQSENPTLGTVELYEMLATQLSKIAIRSDKPWTWRYAQGVHKGTIQPSAVFAQAIQALGATLDDAPASVVYSVRVQVLARPGAIQPGAIVLGESRACAWPGCPVQFVPRVPWQKYCSQELHLQAERERRSRSRKAGVA